MKEGSGRPYSREDYIRAINSIDNSIPAEGRNTNEYIAKLKIDTEDLEGKRVLDLGAGNNLNFARKLSDEGIKAEVVSLSPAFRDGKTWNSNAEGADEAGRLAVAGMGEELPFKSNSFDTVVAFYVTMYIPTEERIATILKEIVRVLKPEGTAYIGPLIDMSKIPVGFNTNKIWLKEENIKGPIEGSAEAIWEENTSTSEGARVFTLKIVKNKE